MLLTAINSNNLTTGFFLLHNYSCLCFLTTFCCDTEHTAPIQLQPDGWKTTVQHLQLTGERIPSLLPHLGCFIFAIFIITVVEFPTWYQAISLFTVKLQNKTALQTNDGEPPLIPISNSQPFCVSTTFDLWFSHKKDLFLLLQIQTNYFKCKLAEYWPAGCLWGCRVWISMGKCSLLRMISWFLPVNLLALLMLLVCQSVQ